MALQSALNRLRTGKCVEKLDDTPAKQEVASVRPNTSVALSLFAVDGNDSFNFDEDDNEIIRADDIISFSLPLNESRTDVEDVRNYARVSPRSGYHDNDTPFLSKPSTSGDNRFGGTGVRDTCVMDHVSQYDEGRDACWHGGTERHGRETETESNTCFGKKHPLTKETRSTPEDGFKLRSASAQKLNLFKFVKTDRKRSVEGRERNEINLCGRPPLKKPADKSNGRCVHQAGSEEVVGGMREGEAELCGDRTEEKTSNGWVPWQSNVSSKVGNIVLFPSAGASNQASVSAPATSMCVASDVPPARRDNQATVSTPATSIHVAGDAPPARRNNQATVSTPATSIHVAGDAHPARRNRTPSDGILTTPISANGILFNLAQRRPYGVPESITPSRAGFTKTIPLRGAPLTKPTSGLMASIVSTTPSTSLATRSKFLPQQKSIGSPATQFPSCLNNPVPNTSWDSSSQANITPSKYSTPQGKRLPSSMPAALICTPTNELGSVGVGVIETPVPLPRRRFPGPAGLLPPLIPGQNMEQIYIAPPSIPSPASTPRLSCLPTTRVVRNQGEAGEAREFGQGPWVEMLEDLDLNDSHSSALLDYTILQAVKQFVGKLLSNGKVVHLRVILKSITLSGINASGVLKDPSGEIMCTIHRQVLEDHKRELQVGAVLILRQVSMFSPSPRKHYLNITPSNIVRVYPPEGTSNTITTPLLLSEIERKLSDNKATTFPRPHPPTPVAGRLNPSPTARHLFGPSQSDQLDQLLLEKSGGRKLATDTPRFCRIRSFGKGSSQCSNPDFVSKDVGNHEKNEADKDVGTMFFTNICEDEFNDLFSDMAD